MNFLKFATLNLIVFISVLSCSDDNSTTEDTEIILNPSEKYEALNISYGTDSNQNFDLYLPANRTTATKTMVLVHGGGWNAGDKSEMNDIKNLLIQDFPNLAIVNINYKLADANHAPYPMQLNDITSVINYIKDKKTLYTISEDIGFIGLSAGAHLSLLWSYDFDTDNNVNMVCSIVGPTNLTDPAYLNNTKPDLQVLLDLYGKDTSTQFLEKASPYHQATALSPPTILFYGGQDYLIPTSQGIDMRDKLESLEVTHQFTLYPDSGHGLGVLEFIDTWTKLKIFVNTHL